MSQTRGKRKVFAGTVVSDKTDKTRVVSVERVFRHAFYGKTMRRHVKFYAHDETNASARGDRVEIMSSRPMSKLKRWRVTKIINKR